MKVAFCLYGQPRLAQRGHENIAAFVRRQHADVSFDFFFHVWHDPNKTHYDASPWRKIPDNELCIDKDLIPFLLDAYRPVMWEMESPKTLDMNGIEKSILFQRSNVPQKRNVNNTLSQLYSRQCVRNLVLQSNNIYDMIVTSRFDFLNPVEVDLQTLDPSKIYVSDLHVPRKVFPDNFFISNPTIFFSMFNSFTDLPNMMNDQALHQTMQALGEQADLGVESILFASFLKHFSPEDKVVYTREIPDFH